MESSREEILENKDSSSLQSEGPPNIESNGAVEGKDLEAMESSREEIVENKDSSSLQSEDPPNIESNDAVKGKDSLNIENSVSDQGDDPFSNVDCSALCEVSMSVENDGTVQDNDPLNSENDGTDANECMEFGNDFENGSVNVSSVGSNGEGLEFGNTSVEGNSMDEGNGFLFGADDTDLGDNASSDIDYGDVEVKVEFIEGEEPVEFIEGEEPEESISSFDTFGALMNKDVSEALFMEHAVLANGNRIHCQLCGRYCSASRGFDHHLQNVHPEVVASYLEDPSKNYSLEDDMESQKTSPGIKAKTYKCHQCNLAYRYKRGLRRHLKRCGIPSEVPKDFESTKAPRGFGCDMCGKRFAAKSTLKLHVVKSHSDMFTFSHNDGVFQCEWCNEVFVKESKYQKHIEMHQIKGIEIRQYQCSKCSKTYKYKRGLRRHIKDSHRPSQSNSSTGSVPNVDSSTGSVADVELNDIDVKVENVSEEEMQSAEVSEEETQQSTEVSKEEKQFSEINKILSQSSDVQVNPKKKLLQTKKNVLQSSDVQVYPCKTCGMEFLTEESMESHAEKHGDTADSLKCVECDKVYKYRKGLRRHMKEAHFAVLQAVPKKFDCAICGESFSEKSVLEDHLNSVHQDACPPKESTSESFHCVRCALDFTDKDKYDDHVKIHETENRFQCPTCKKTYTRKCKLTKHLQQNNCHLTPKEESKGGDFDEFENTNLNFDGIPSVCVKTEAEAPPEGQDNNISFDISLVCKVCGKLFESEPELKAHQKEHVNPYVCSICDANFKSKSKMMFHMMIHLEGEPKCKLCDKTFVNFRGLQRHMRLHKNVINYLCEYCGEGCRDRKYFKRHIRRHTNEPIPKPFHCSVCNKAFRDNSNLAIHMNKHTRERACACNICGKILSDPRTLKIHIARHTGENQFTCPICNKSFAYQSYRKTHMRSHTQEKPYECEFCSKSFTQRSSLNTHMQMHSERKTYVCTVCEKPFLYAHYLKVHMRSHTGERPYECSECGKAFAQKCTLNTHKKSCYGYGYYY